ncbi:10877_t:CDS:1, partial [Racocetra persica]
NTFEKLITKRIKKNHSSDILRGNSFEISTMEKRQCVITKCAKAPGQPIRGVTGWFWNKAQENCTLPGYLKIDDAVCQLCYNKMVVWLSDSIKKHARLIDCIDSIQSLDSIEEPAQKLIRDDHYSIRVRGDIFFKCNKGYNGYLIST